MVRNKRGRWFEDFRHSMPFGDDILLWADNLTDWIELSESFHDAAQAAIRAYYHSSRGKITPVSVAGFLYRHSIELILKTIVIVEKRATGVLEEFLQIHDLNALWKESRNSMEKFYNDERNKAILTQIQEWITKLNDWDVDATCFRYPKLIQAGIQQPNLHELVWTCEHIYRRLMQCLEGMWNSYDQQE